MYDIIHVTNYLFILCHSCFLDFFYFLLLKITAFCTCLVRGDFKTRTCGPQAPLI